MRLDRVVSEGLFKSHSISKDLIKKGKIKVNGTVVKKSDEQISDSDIVEYEGQPLRRGFVLIMMNKPLGVLSATEDKRDKTAVDLLPEDYKRAKLGIAGRLDKDSSGLLIITNNGPLNHMLTSPSSGVEKVYRIETDKPCGKEDVEAFRNGVKLNDFTALPAVLEPDPQEPTKAVVKICEGKYRQIRRMLLSLGKNTLSLKRESIGPIVLDKNLKEGEYRFFTQEETRIICDFLQI